MARTFTREEFYALVWSKPLTHLAKEFVLSDVALHKICKKHDIPHPPLGWWAKKAAGKPVKQTPLPRLKDASLDRVTIVGGEIRPEPNPIAAVRENARVLASAIEATDEPPANRIVERTIARLRTAKPSDINGLVSIDQPGLIKVRVAPASADRLSLALNRIAAVAEPMGIRLVGTDKFAAFECEGETIGFTVTEGVNREKHVPTEKERAEEAAWRKKREKEWGVDSWRLRTDLYRFRLPEWDYHPTGQLTFEFDVSRWSLSRRSFRDAKVQRLENMAAEIAVGIVVAAAAIKEDRIRRQDHARREEEEQNRRERALRAKHVEKRRGDALDKLLEEVGSLDRLRRLVTALRAAQRTETTGRVAAFVAFASARLVAREEALTAAALERRLSDSKLFGEDDDFDFNPWLRR